MMQIGGKPIDFAPADAARWRLTDRFVMCAYLHGYVDARVSAWRPRVVVSRLK